MREKLNAYKNLIESNLAKFVNTDSKLLEQSMLYSLEAGGKRLRPILVLEFCKLFSGEYEMALPYATAIEMIHTYSLIHDDLPCMDNDDLRRGKPTNHKKFTEDTALLAGDALLNSAFEVMSNPENAQYFGAEKVLNTLYEVSKCAGANGMIYGQVLDINSEVSEIEELVLIHKNKTGKLLRASCVCGAILGGADENQQSLVADFAMNLGIAFQIKDDILDKYGDVSKLGKPIGSDEKSGKKTYTAFYTMEECEELVEKYTDLSIKSLDSFENTEFLIDLAKKLTKREY